MKNDSYFISDPESAPSPAPRFVSDSVWCRYNLPSRVFMPAHYMIYAQYHLVISTAEGRVTFDEVCAHQDQLWKDPNFNPEFDQLIDGTRVSDVTVTGDQIKTMMTRKIFSPTSRRAAVATSTFVYGIGRMMQTYYEISPTASPMVLFRDRASALKWLGIPKDSGLF